MVSVSLCVHSEVNLRYNRTVFLYSHARVDHDTEGLVQHLGLLIFLSELESKKLIFSIFKWQKENC